METVDMHEAKPLVKVVALNAPEPVAKSRFGFLKGMITVPEIREDFKAIGAEEVEEMFHGEVG